MANSPRRVVARSVSTSELVPPIRLRGAADTLRHEQDEIRNRLGLALPTVEPEYHLFQKNYGSVAAAMQELPASAPTRTLRCVIEVEQDSFTAHGTSARPVILVQVGESAKGWSSSADGAYDAIVCVTAHQVKQLLVDLFLDFSLSSSSYLRYIFDAYINKFGFTEYGKRKAEFARAAALTQTRFGPVCSDIEYVNFSSLTDPTAVRDLEALIRLWEAFALNPAFREFATVESAAVSLGGRRKIGRKIDAPELRRALNNLETGAYALIAVTPLSQPTRGAFARAKVFAEEMNVLPGISIGNNISLASAESLLSEYSKTRKHLLRNGHILIERFIIQR